jgi:hypothetical protein
MANRRKSTVCLATLILAGCASNPRVEPLGPDTYLVIHEAATGFTGADAQRIAALDHAARYCATQQKALQVINTTVSSPPYIFGHYPRAEVQFMCLKSDDPRLKRTLVAVSIASTPAGADVSVDGAFVGSTPLPDYAMSAGEHTIEISKSGFLKWSRKILVQSGVPTGVSASLDSLPHPNRSTR